MDQSVGKHPKVFIIVLNYNGKDVIKACLSSIFKIDYPDYEVVFVDNASDDGSLELAKSNFSKANFIRNSHNLGFSAGNNVGIRFALERMADYVLLINNDTEVERDFLSRLVDFGEKDPSVGILSPVIFEGKTRKIWFSGGKIDWLRLKIRHEDDVKKQEAYETAFVTGCSMLVKASVFKKIGLFDEDFFLYWEDADFSLRSQRAGFKSQVVSSSWIYHFEKSQSNHRKIYWLVLSGLMFFRKNASWWLRPWGAIHFWLRRIKNSKDIKSRRSDNAQMVKKAYEDFKRFQKDR